MMQFKGLTEQTMVDRMIDKDDWIGEVPSGYRQASQYFKDIHYLRAQVN